MTDSQPEMLISGCEHSFGGGLDEGFFFRRQAVGRMRQLFQPSRGLRNGFK
jgi:hypothetical protein